VLMFRGRLSRDASKRGAIGSRDEHEVKAHMLSEFPQLILDGPAGIGALGV